MGAPCPRMISRNSLMRTDARGRRKSNVEETTRKLSDAGLPDSWRTLKMRPMAMISHPQLLAMTYLSSTIINLANVCSSKMMRAKTTNSLMTRTSTRMMKTMT